MNRQQLERCRRLLYTRLPLVGGLLRRRAAQALVRDNSLEAVRLLTEAVTRSDDGAVRALAADALRRLTNPRHREAVGAAWLETRHAGLASLLAVCPWRGEAPLRVQVYHALQQDRRDLLTPLESRAAEALVQACADADVEIAKRARDVLGTLQTPEGREALCRLALRPDAALAREVALTAGYAPADGRQRALFYFLTEQWALYEGLDFDQALLRAVYQAGDEELRRRIAVKARQVGRLEWVAVVTGGRQQRRLGEMTDAEWQVTVDVLRARGQWPDLWRLARAAPAPWAARCLALLKEAAWRPPEAGFDELARLAEGWQEPDLAALVRPQPVSMKQGGPVTALAFGADGGLLASGGADGAVRLWRLPDGQALRACEGHPGGVTCLAIHPDARTLVSGAHDRLVRRWTLPDGRPLPPLPEEPRATVRLAFTPDGTRLAGGLGAWAPGWEYADGAGLVRLWDFEPGRVVATLTAQNAAVTSLAVSPDGRLLVSGGSDARIRVWGLPEGDFRQLLLAGEPIAALAISPDGRTLASGGYDRAVRLWRLPTGEPLGKLDGHTADVTCLALSPDGRVLASGGHDHAVCLWNLPEPRLLRRLHEPTGAVTCVAISPDGRLLATGGKDSVVRLWSLLPLRLAHAPTAQMNRRDLAWVEETLQEVTLPVSPRRALEFLAALIRWRLRYDIEVGEAPRRVTVGEFDIEILG